MAKESNLPKIGMRPGGGHPNLGQTGEKAKDFAGTASRLLTYLKPYRIGFYTVLTFALISTLFSIFGPKILGLAVDELFKGVMEKLHHVTGARIDMARVARILSVLLGLYLASALFGYLQEYLLAGIAQRMIRRMRNEVSEKLNRLPLRFFDSKTHGEILSRVTNDIDVISNTLQQSLVQVVTSAITLVGITVMMLLISPVLSLVAFLMLPASYWVTSFIAKKSQKYYTVQQKTLGQLNGYVEEMYDGHTIVKAFNYERRSLREFGETNAALYDCGWKAQFVTGIIYPLLNFLSNLAFIGVCVLGGYFTAMGRMTLGSVQAFIMYARQFNQPIMQMANIVNIFQATVAAAERVFEVLDEREELPDPADPVSIEHPRGTVRFNHIAFRYEADKPLIEDLSMEVEAGQLVAIVGPTGAGKTTLVNLLMRFYELDKGSITVDGIDITRMRRRDLHRLFGMVLQDAVLFKGTIRDNIAYGKKDATEEEVIRAAGIALADPFIRTLPEGYDTIINEEGSNISQGQKQLITIARAVIADPPVMILDEATSSIDSRTEILIQQAMNRLMRDKTSFVIAHRLSTIREADSILVMNEGQIVETGTHPELLARGGFYASLYNSQFAED